MKLLKITTLVAVAVAFSGCASQMSWQRADGGPVNGWAFDRASDKCRHKALNQGEAAVSVMQRCMARYGFVWAASYYNNNDDYNDYGYSRHRRHGRYNRYDD